MNRLASFGLCLFSISATFLAVPSQAEQKDYLSAEMLNALMNAYVGCVDDAADLVQLGIQKQENIRPAIDLMASRAKEFLQILEKLSADGTEIDIYKDNLDDAIEGTRDAMNDAEKAKKAVAPPPVRRKN